MINVASTAAQVHTHARIECGPAVLAESRSHAMTTMGPKRSLAHGLDVASTVPIERAVARVCPGMQFGSHVYSFENPR